MDAFSGVDDDGGAFTQEYLALEAVAHAVVFQLEVVHPGSVHGGDAVLDLVQRDDPGGIRGVEHRGAYRGVLRQVQIYVQAVKAHFQGRSRRILHQGPVEQRHAFRNGERAAAGDGALVVDDGPVTEYLGVPGQGDGRAVAHVDPVEQAGGFFRGDGPVRFVVRTAHVERDGGMVSGRIGLAGVDGCPHRVVKQSRSGFRSGQQRNGIHGAFRSGAAQFPDAADGSSGVDGDVVRRVFRGEAGTRIGPAVQGIPRCFVPRRRCFNDAGGTDGRRDAGSSHQGRRRAAGSCRSDGSVDSAGGQGEFRQQPVGFRSSRGGGGDETADVSHGQGARGTCPGGRSGHGFRPDGAAHIADGNIGMGLVTPFFSGEEAVGVHAVGRGGNASRCSHVAQRDVFPGFNADGGKVLAFIIGAGGCGDLTVQPGNVHLPVVGLDASGSVAAGRRRGNAAGGGKGADVDVLVARALVVHGISVGIQSPRIVSCSQVHGDFAGHRSNVQAPLIGVNAIGGEIGRDGDEGVFRDRSDGEYFPVAPDAGGIRSGCGDVECSCQGADVHIDSGGGVNAEGVVCRGGDVEYGIPGNRANAEGA